MAKTDVGAEGGTGYGRQALAAWAAGVSMLAVGLGAWTPAIAQTAASVGQVDALVVTARKHSEPLSRAPVSLTAFGEPTLQTFNITTFNDYATKTPNLSFTYGGGPTGVSEARTVAIRGVTGQGLLGASGATGFYIDETPVPASVDLRVLDIDRIEVLKGPQGDLFGESSLGGAVRLITKAPDQRGAGLTVTADMGATSHGGGVDSGFSLVGNAAPAPGRLALRLVAFASHDAGYLTRTFPDPSSAGAGDPFLSVPRHRFGDQGAKTTYGGSVTALIQMSERFEARSSV